MQRKTLLAVALEEPGPGTGVGMTCDVSEGDDDEAGACVGVVVEELPHPARKSESAIPANSSRIDRLTLPSVHGFGYGVGFAGP
jgi:hypothetical protein